jgi:hypothetical protein
VRGASTVALRFNKKYEVTLNTFIDLDDADATIRTGRFHIKCSGSLMDHA